MKNATDRCSALIDVRSVRSSSSRTRRERARDDAALRDIGHATPLASTRLDCRFYC